MTDEAVKPGDRELQVTQPQSMTGYGRSTSGMFTVEVRSSNHKHIDIQINMPYFLFPHELDIRKAVKNSFSRGRIDIFVQRHGEEGLRLRVNKALAREYYNAFLSLKNELSITGDIGIGVIAGQKDIFILDEPEINESELFDALKNALLEAGESRVREGKNLIDDITSRIDSLQVKIDEIEGDRTRFSDEARKRLHDRLAEILANVPIDESRIIQEVAILSERTDITEEVVRVRSHLKQFNETLSSGGAIGKKMDFIVQEIRREVNTIGAKSQDFEINRRVVEMKHELEKIREQIQNLQ